MLGDKWKALSESERKPYDDKAAADKKRYEEEKAKYNAVRSHPHYLQREGNKKQLTKRNRAATTRSRPKRVVASLYCAASGVCVSC